MITQTTNLIINPDRLLTQETLIEMFRRPEKEEQIIDSLSGSSPKKSSFGLDLYMFPRIIVKSEFCLTAMLTTARKNHICCQSHLPIAKGSQYYSIYYGNINRASNPDRVLPEHLEAYWQRMKEC